jgi:hypothetical protein
MKAFLCDLLRSPFFPGWTNWPSESSRSGSWDRLNPSQSKKGFWRGSQNKDWREWRGTTFAIIARESVYDSARYDRERLIGRSSSSSSFGFLGTGRDRLVHAAPRSCLRGTRERSNARILARAVVGGWPWLYTPNFGHIDWHAAKRVTRAPEFRFVEPSSASRATAQNHDFLKRVFGTNSDFVCYFLHVRMS